ncbi:MAG: SAM-dependent methyltransferase [Methylotetracoccus sp.]|nr:SAM-dependent methyltransferase [Methylotetracoccus sp.]
MALPPPKLLLAAVALISAGALSYEILLMRLFAIIQWHHFASMLISLALLGYGASGTFLTRCRQVLLPLFGSIFTLNAALFGVSAVACFMIAAKVPLNPLEILWSWKEWGHLMVISTVLMLPFFFAANCIGLTFQRYHDSIGRIYAADLIGAGTGAMAVIVLLFLVFPGRALQIVGFVGIAAAVLGGLATKPQPRWVLTVTLLSLGMLSVLGQRGTASTEPGEYKALAQLTRVMGTRRIKERSSPLGLLTVVASPAVPLRHAPGLSLMSRAVAPEQLAVFTDGDGMTVINRWDGTAESAAFLDDMPSALPYHLLAPQPRVLILGAGGGTEVLQALVHGAERIDAVELNPQLIHLARQSFGSFSGRLYDHPRVTLHFADARGFVSAVDARYTLIQLALIDGFNAAGAGVHAVQEDYLYTREALADYLSRLTSGGFLAITRWVRLPPRDGVKLLATAVAALEGLGITQPGRRLAWIRNWQVTTLLIKNGDYTREETHRIRRFCDERAFDVAYLPGPEDPATEDYTTLDQPFFSAAAAALLGPDREQFVRDYPFHIAPATDDQPYFFHFFRWPLLKHAWAQKGIGGLSLSDMGYPVLIATLLQALALSALLILTPLPATGHSGSTDPDRPRRFRAAVYFSCIGLAFMFIEIVCIQKFTLYLAHPLYAIPVVLASFLVFAGAGSHLAAHVPRRSARGRAALATMAVMLLMALHLTYVTGLLHTTLHWSTLTKIALVTASTAPLAVCMGVLFPLGMTRLTYADSALLPWAYAINGCASVVAAVLASLLAIHFGQTAVLLVATSLYAIAAWFVP